MCSQKINKNTKKQCKEKKIPPPQLLPSHEMNLPGWQGGTRSPKVLLSWLLEHPQTPEGLSEQLRALVPLYPLPWRCAQATPLPTLQPLQHPAATAAPSLRIPVPPK